jgi:hypothetical protein
MAMVRLLRTVQFGSHFLNELSFSLGIDFFARRHAEISLFSLNFWTLLRPMGSLQSLQMREVSD